MNLLTKDTAETGYTPVSVLFLITMILISCSGNHLIHDQKYLLATERAFDQRKHLLNKDSAFNMVFNKKLSPERSEALMFLYAYMPLSDLADYNCDFFLANVDISLRTRSETKWGKEIPEEIFLHYVLPCRVNNENLDSFRIVYYDELVNRIKGRKLMEAALEINHWCHEKVTYQPADIRTSGPVSTILSARGRCGEESTLTVAALRTVGIPARQVYTPRWAHTDDNHAWVEIWSDGNWYYMGACEPEPVLDKGWFTEPARRAMLIHTKSFGGYLGNEKVINRNINYTDVNNLSKYAVTKKIFVKVVDNKGVPVNNASVEYQLYNYAEFYPLAVVPTNNYGISQFETGLGDLLVWAYKDDKFDFKKISVSETDTLILKPDNKLQYGNSIDMDLDVPLVRTPLPVPLPELIQQNSERFSKENVMRQKYIDSWMTPSESKKLALRLNVDTARVMNIIARSMGNYQEISSFLSDTADSLLKTAMSLLEILPDKDLRDAKSHILSDHLTNSALTLKVKVKAKDEVKVKNDEKNFLEYVLNPRVSNEMLVAWRHVFLKVLPTDFLSAGSKDPSLIVRYLDNNIKISDENYYGTPITPVGVLKLKVSDAASRAICFVAICRSLGIPARLEPGRNEPQYFINGNWNDVYFYDQKKPDLKKGYLKLRSTDTKPVPEYYIQFTLARYENGRYNTLEYEFNKKITDFKEELALPAGQYMLVTGNRLNDGRILSNISFFDLSENEHKKIEVKIRKDIIERKILGNIDLKKISSLYHLDNSSQACDKNTGLVIIWMEPEKEPTKHVFNDLPVLRDELNALRTRFLFLSDSTKNSSIFNHEILKGLPVNSSFGPDINLALLKNTLKPGTQTETDLPVVLVSDKDGNIIFLSTGYRVGIGEQILKYLK